MSGGRDAVAVAPDDPRNAWLADAVRAGGGRVVDTSEADGLVWAIPRHPERLAELLEANPQIRWVQLPFAGIETFIHLTADGRTWTCGKGVYADPVAELALTLLLGGMRGMGVYARRTTWEKSDANELGNNLLGARVTILGGGGIAESLLRLLGGFGAATTVLRRDGSTPTPGADRTLGVDMLHEVFATSDAVVLALAMTPETHGIIDAAALAALPEHAWLVNVARGPHVVTDDLVAALRDGVDRRRRAGRDRSRAAARRPPAVDHAQRAHHAARRQHAGHGGAAAGRPRHRERAPPDRGGTPDRPRRPRARVLSAAAGQSVQPVPMLARSRSPRRCGNHHLSAPAAVRATARAGRRDAPARDAP